MAITREAGAIVEQLAYGAWRASSRLTVLRARFTASAIARIVNPRSPAAPPAPRHLALGAALSLLAKGHSPEQIAGILRRVYLGDPDRHGSPGTSTPGPGRGSARADRGHGLDPPPAVGMLVERSFLFVTLAKLADGTAKSAVIGFSCMLNRIDAQKRLSMTYDQDKEMAAHATLARRTGIKVYFADPHSPWQRGINENINGLLRQYLPKGADLSVLSQRDLDAIAFDLNVRPRKSLGWKCPLELFMPESFNYETHFRKHVALPT